MQKGSQDEMSTCPRCHQIVPRTLYCLNCGYPLYREAKEEDHTIGDLQKEEAETQVISSFEAESQIGSEEIKPPEPPQPLEEDQGEMEEAMVRERLEAEAVQDLQDNTLEAMPTPQASELTGEIPDTCNTVTAEPTELSTDELKEAPVEVVLKEEDKPRMEPLADETVEAESIQEAAGAEMEAIEASEVREQPPRSMIDPMILEVMDNLAKNISLKVKLINLAVRGDIKETTLKNLLKNYAMRGELWINKRNEILERGRYEISTLEKAIEKTRAGLEELEIRKAIGDASDDEYAAKAPAYEWDINHLNEELTRKRLEVDYLESLSKAMSIKDFGSLKETASSCHRDIEELAVKGRFSPETVAEMRSILDEALELLKD